MRFVASFLLCCSASVAVAQDDALPPAPDYFVAGAFDAIAAQRIALSCPSLSLDVEAVRAATGALMDQLRADGFDTSRPDGGMDPSREAFAVRQRAFMERHGLVGGVTAETVCAAGQAEISEDSGIGALLTEVPG